jgi:homoserine dehydrogenase
LRGTRHEKENETENEWKDKMTRKKLKLGVFGFGVVGKGLYDVLQSTPGLHADIVKICVKHRDKKRPIGPENFTYDPDELLNNPDINVIVELIDDADAAFEITKKALQNGKGVVSANKKMIAEHFSELLKLQQDAERPFLYEAACCASIPVVRNLEEYYDNDLLQSLRGIINGSTNYILTQMSVNNASYDEALQQAQALGYAESNPALDVEGFDAKNKLSIFLVHAFGLASPLNELFHLGINRIRPLDSRYAKEKGYKIKLTACARKVKDDGIAAYVLPQFIAKDDRLFQIDDVFNGVEIEGAFADKQFFSGKGAGAHPTASAVLSDISALSYDYHYEYKKIHQNTRSVITTDFPLRVFVSFPDELSALKFDFIDIEEQYQARSENYLTGTIHFEKLINSQWIKDVKVSVITFE